MPTLRSHSTPECRRLSHRPVIASAADQRRRSAVAELCQQYMADVEAGRLLTKAEGSQDGIDADFRPWPIARHIIPSLGRRSVASVTRDDVEAFMHDIATGKTVSRQKTKPRGLSVVRGGHGVASRSVWLLRATFTYAIRKGLRFDTAATNCTAGRRQNRRIAPPLVGSGLHGDSSRSRGMTIWCSPVGPAASWPQEDVAEDCQVGWTSSRHHAPCPATELRQSCR
jgi:hypothetical protein